MTTETTETSTSTITIRNPFLCPNCGKENARWNSEQELVICPDCSQEIDLDDYALNAAITAERDDDDGLEMRDNSCSECGHPYKPGDETHYPECPQIFIGM